MSVRKCIPYIFFWPYEGIRKKQYAKKTRVVEENMSQNITFLVSRSRCTQRQTSTMVFSINLIRRCPKVEWMLCDNVVSFVQCLNHFIIGNTNYLIFFFFSHFSQVSLLLLNVFFQFLILNILLHVIDLGYEKEK